MADQEDKGESTLRRSGARREASERVTVRDGAFETTGWTLNVSRGGMRLIVEDPVDEGREYELTSLTGDKSTTRRGRVVGIKNQADGQIIGIQYLDVDESVPPPPNITAPPLKE